MAEWIRVEDELPLRFIPVLVCRKKGRVRLVQEGYREFDGRWKVYGTKTADVTHWMPLPEPPEVEV